MVIPETLAEYVTEANELNVNVRFHAPLQFRMKVCGAREKLFGASENC